MDDANIHYRADGTEYRGQVFDSGKGFLFGEGDLACNACNGSGRGMRGPCPRCRGNRVVYDQFKVYTPADYAKLHKQQLRRRNAKQTAEIERQEAIAQAHADYVATHQNLFDKARAERSNSFLQDLVDKSERLGGLTDAQTRAMESAIAAIEAERARYASSTALGQEGDPIDRVFECLGIRRTEKPNFRRTGMETVHIHELRDDEGNAAIVFGRQPLVAVGDRIRIEGKVGRIDDRRGYPCTILSSPKILTLEQALGPAP